MKLMNYKIISQDNGILIIFLKNDYLLKIGVEIFVEGNDADLQELFQNNQEEGKVYRKTDEAKLALS